MCGPDDIDHLVADALSDLAEDLAMQGKRTDLTYPIGSPERPAMIGGIPFVAREPDPQAEYDRVIAEAYPDGNVPTGEDPADRDKLVDAIMRASAAYDEAARYAPLADDEDLTSEYESLTNWASAVPAQDSL